MKFQAETGVILVTGAYGAVSSVVIGATASGIAAITYPSCEVALGNNGNVANVKTTDVTYKDVIINPTLTIDNQTYINFTK